MSPAGLRQPDQRTCGATCAVVAVDLAAGRPPTGRGTSFDRDVLDAHRRLTRLRLHGRLQLPWPRALGTPPWALARELSAATGRPHRVRLVRWSRRRSVPPAGALYVGTRWLPRHVLLVLADGSCYNPATGRVLPLDDPRLTRWSTPWFTVGAA